MKKLLRQGQRLKSRKEIGRLFGGKARSISSYPVRAVFTPAAERRSSAPVQVTFVVPKRRFRKAVDRNRLKRRLREAYRLNQHLLTESMPPGGGQLAVLFMYTGKEPMEYAYIERKMKRVLTQIAAPRKGPAR